MSRQSVPVAVRRVGLVLCCAACLAAGDAATPPAPQAAAPAVKAAIIVIRDEINDVTFKSMVRRFEEARAGGATVIVLELDTPGGLVTSALDICNYLKNVDDLRTVAWVHPHAFSAGSLIAVSCHEIIMSHSSRMGDCAPIMMSPTDGLANLGETERAKAESPILKEFRDSAHRRGYDPLLCESMVRLGNEVYWFEKSGTSVQKFVSVDDKDRYLGKDSPDGPWQLVRRRFDPVADKEVDVQQPIVKKNDLLTLTQTEGMWYGFSKALVSSPDELRRYVNAEAAPKRFDENWAEHLAGWLSSPFVRSILFILILMGAYAEFHAPGHMVGGVVAVLALALFLGAPYLTGLANVWEIVIVILGVGLIVFELLVTPGFGVAGVLGIALTLVGLVASFVQPEIPSTPGLPSFFQWPRYETTWRGVRVGVTVISGGLLVAAIGMAVLSRFLPRSPLLNRLITPNPSPVEVAPADPYPLAAQMGDIGVAESLLRPAGKARFGPMLVDVVSESEYIDAGARVRVIERQGNRVVVRKLRDNEWTRSG